MPREVRRAGVILRATIQDLRRKHSEICATIRGWSPDESDRIAAEKKAHAAWSNLSAAYHAWSGTARPRSALTAEMTCLLADSYKACLPKNYASLVPEDCAWRGVAANLELSKV